MHQIKCCVTGKVQFVMFRDFVLRNARMLNLVGYVKNMKDGSVCIVAQGNKKQLTALTELLLQGPAFAKVQNVTEEWCDPIETFSDFHISY